LRVAELSSRNAPNWNFHVNTISVFRIRYADTGILLRYRNAATPKEFQARGITDSRRIPVLEKSTSAFAKIAAFAGMFGPSRE